MLMPLGVRAATNTWVGNTSTNMGTAGNWSNSTLPVSGDAWSFAAAGTAGANLTNTLATSSNWIVAGINFASTASAYTIYGGAFTLNGGITNNAAAGQTIYSALTITSSITLNSAVNSGSANITLAGNLSGNGTIGTSVTGTSARSIQLTGDNSGFTGTVNVNNASGLRFRLNAATAGSASATWNMNNNTTAGTSLGYGTGTLSLGALTGGGQIRQDAGGTSTLRIGDLGTSTTFSGLFAQANVANMIKILKVGAGTLTLSSGSSSYTGGTEISNGAIKVDNASALGSAATTNYISFTGGKLLYGTGITTDFSSRFTNGAGQLVSIDTGGNNVTFGSALTSSGGTLTKSGAGTLTLGGANSYTGKTTIAGGALSVAAANGLGGNPGSATADQVTISNGGKLLVTTGFTANANAGMTIGSGGGTVEVNGAQSLVQGGGLSGSGALSKSGSGTLSLTNTSGDYSGTITVTNGTLQVNTALASAAVIVGNTVSKGSTLSGAGTLGAVTINSGGIIAPGNSPGTLSVSSLALNSGGGYNWELADATGVAGTGWDLINVGSGSGTLSIGATSGNQFNLYVLGSPSIFNTANSYSWTIIDAGTITGFDANAFNIDASGLSYTGNLGNFAVSTNSGNLLLDYTPVSSSYDVTVASGSQTQSEATGGAAQFTGASALNKLGAGTLVMTNSANDYTGLTSVKEGTMQIDVNAPSGAAGALGNAATAVVIGTTTNAVGAAFNIGVAGVTNSRGLATVAGTNVADRVIETTITSGVAEQAGNVTANTNTSFSAAGGGTLLVSGGISGAGALTVTNTGTTIFSGGNTYTGTTTVAGNATLRLAHSAALGTADGSTTVNDGGVLAYSNNISVGEAVTINGTGISSGGAIRNISGANTNSGVVTLGSSSLITADSGTSLNLSGGVAGGANALTKAGNGTLTLSSIGTYTGGTTVNAGTLNLGVGGSTGTLRGTLTINSGATVKATAVDALGYTAGVSLTNVTINGGTFDNAATNNNGYLTTFFMNGGTISSSGGGAINFNGTGYGITTSSNAETATVSAPITLRANGATFNVAAGSTSSGVDLLASGVINGAYGWVKTGAGTMKITSGTSYGSSWFTNNGGTIILAQTNQAAFTTAVINSGATLKMDPTAQVTNAQAWSGQFANDVTVNAGGVWDLNDTGTNGVNNRVKFVYGAGTISNSGTGESAVVFALRDFNTGKTNTLSIVDGTNGGTVSLWVISSGGGFNGLAAVLAGSNSYSGATTLSDENLTAGSTTAFSPNSVVYFNWGARLNLSGYDNTVGGLANGLWNVPTGTTNVDLGANVLTLTNKAATSQTFAGVIVGTGSLIKNGAGTQILTGANTYSGGTLVSAGVLQGNATGLQGSITNNASVVFDQTGAGTYAGNMSGSGTLSSIGAGTLTLSGNNSFSGGTSLRSGQLNINNANAIGSGTLAIEGGTIDNTSGAAITLANNNAQNWNADFAFAGSTNINLGTGAVTLSANRTVTVTANQLTVGGAIGGNYGLTKAGAGTLTLSGSSTFNGGLTISSGTVAATGTNSASFRGNVGAGDITLNGGTLQTTLANSTSITILSNVITVGASGGTLKIVGPTTAAATPTFKMDTAGKLTGSGTLNVVGTGSLGTVANSNSVLILGAANSGFSGVVNLKDGGILEIGSAGALGSGSLTIGNQGMSMINAVTLTNTVTLNSGGVVGFNGNGTYSNIVLNADGIIRMQSWWSTQTNNGTIAGAISGNYGLQINAGTITNGTPTTLNLKGTNTYTGNTTITNVNLSVSGLLGNGNYAGNIAATNSTLTFGSAANQTLSGVISGNSALTKSGAGTLTLSGANSYSGGMLVSAGVLQGNSSSLQGDITNNAALTFDQSSTGTYSGALSGTGYITKSGTGTLTLSASNNYTGGTLLNGGKLVAGNANAFGTGGITIGAGTYLDLSTYTIANNLTNNGGGILSSGTLENVTAESGTTDLGGNNSTVSSISGSATFNVTGSGTTVAAMSGGTLNVNGASTVVTNYNGGNIGISNSRTLTIRGGTSSGVISGAGGMTKSGTSTLTLRAKNTYTGATTVEAGELVLNGTNASATTVQSGAALGGSGTLASVTIESGGTISPGNSPGTLTITNGLTWNGGGNYDWQIYGVSGSAGQTNTWDLINLTGGALTLTGLSLENKFNVNLVSLETLPSTQGALAGFDNTQNYSWTILSSSAGLAGLDPNYFNINYTAFATYNDLGTGMFSLVASGNDLNLLFTPNGPQPVPESGTWAAAALLAGGAAFIRWRRRTDGRRRD